MSRPLLSKQMREELERERRTEAMREPPRKDYQDAQLVRSQAAKVGARSATITMTLTTAVGAVIGYFMAGSDGTVRGTVIGAATGVVYQGARGRLA